MTTTTARHLRPGRGSDRSLTSLLRMVDPTRPAGRGSESGVLPLYAGIRARSEQGVSRIGSVAAGMVCDSARIGMPASRRVLSEILCWRPDVVHSQCEFSTYRWAPRIPRTLGTPLVHTYHTIYEDYTH